jgi:hypothetical protein
VAVGGRTIIKWVYYVWHCPLFEVYLIYTTFREMVLLPSSGDWLCHTDSFFYPFYIICDTGRNWTRELLNTRPVQQPIDHRDGPIIVDITLCYTLSYFLSRSSGSHMGLTSNLGSLMICSVVLMNTDSFSFLVIQFSSLCYDSCRIPLHSVVLFPGVSYCFRLDISPILCSVYIL